MQHKPYGRLANYIAMYRRRTGLFQAELATLIGIEREASMARYESGTRLPENIEVLFSLAVALGQPAEEVYAGIMESVREKVALRAQALLESMDDKPTHENLLKIAHLSKLAHPDDEQIIPCEDTA